jgi:hypothetical protein
MRPAVACKINPMTTKGPPQSRPGGSGMESQLGAGGSRSLEFAKTDDA